MQLSRQSLFLWPETDCNAYDANLEMVYVNARERGSGPIMLLVDFHQLTRCNISSFILAVIDNSVLSMT